MFSKIKNKLFGGDGGGYEDISEKRTTKLGYFLLLVMFLFLVGVGQTVFSDLSQLVRVPTAPSACVVTSSTNNLNSLTCGENNSRGICNCTLNDTDVRFGIDTTYAEIKPKLQEISRLNEEARELNKKVVDLNRSITAAERQYQLALQEKIAEEEVLINRDELQMIIIQKREELAELNLQLGNLQEENTVLIAQVLPHIDRISVLHKEARDYYENERAWYKFKVLGLSLLFVIPFFLISTRWYIKAKKSDSPYTIIATSVAAASAILLLQVVVMFLYEILPLGWFAEIFILLSEVPIFRFIIYYGVVALVIALFGGIVFFIQKRIFNPKRVSLRRIKKHECPRCSYSFHHADKFCPSCALPLRETCSQCGNERSIHLHFCAQCGKARENE